MRRRLDRWTRSQSRRHYTLNCPPAPDEPRTTPVRTGAPTASAGRGGGDRRTRVQAMRRRDYHFQPLAHQRSGHCQLRDDPAAGSICGSRRDTASTITLDSYFPVRHHSVRLARRCRLAAVARLLPRLGEASASFPRFRRPVGEPAASSPPVCRCLAGWRDPAGVSPEAARWWAAVSRGAISPLRHQRHHRRRAAVSTTCPSAFRPARLWCHVRRRRRRYSGDGADHRATAAAKRALIKPSPNRAR